MNAPEPIRLIIWDLDETFWSGTLTEGGITYRQDIHDTVVTLAQRGIISAICSKNDLAPVQDILQAHGVWNYFVFPSIDWSAKGPRLRALVEAVQLRPETVVFIDDNPLNRAEAEHFVPGLRTFSETRIGTLLDDPLLQGKPDPALSRLAQYRLLQSRQAAMATAGDTAAFLRDSAVTVSIDYDVQASIGRAIELINRTNQLNYTKQRLPEDSASARAALSAQLASRFIKAALISVRDRYGDYGVCGLYVLQDRHGRPAQLLQFCFSCRILGMGVETWLYRLLGSPALAVQGPVLNDVTQDTRQIDWIGTDQPGARHGATRTARLDYVLLRGGCDIHTIAHYFSPDAGRIVRELHEVRGGVEPTVSHSIMLRHALCGVPDAAREAALPFGLRTEDFTSLIAAPPTTNRPAAWILSFTHDNQTMLYRHKQTGTLIPVRFYKSPHIMRSYIGQTPEAVGTSQAVLDHLQTEFEFAGPIADDLFLENLCMVLASAPANTRVFVLLGNEKRAGKTGDPIAAPAMIQRNTLVRQAVAASGKAEVVALSDCLEPGAAAPLGNHYDRAVYYGIYRTITARLEKAGV